MLTWLEIARKELGQREIAGEADNPRIVAYHSATSYGATDDETPWCSAFVNWVMREAGLPYTKNAAARSWLNWGEPLTDPIPGCVVVLWRGTLSSWAGHVGFYVGDGPNHTITILGGNQGNCVCEAHYSHERVLGFRWPKGIPIPSTTDSVTVDPEYLRELHVEMLAAAQTLNDTAAKVQQWAADITPLLEA